MEHRISFLGIMVTYVQIMHLVALTPACYLHEQRPPGHVSERSEALAEIIWLRTMAFAPGYGLPPYTSSFTPPSPPQSHENDV